MSKTTIDSSKYKKTDLLREVCEIVSKETGKTVPLSLAVSITDAFFDVLVDKLGVYGDGEQKVILAGKFTFKATDAKAKVGRNPATGEQIKIAGRRRVSVTVGQPVKDAVNKKGK